MRNLESIKKEQAELTSSIKQVDDYILASLKMGDVLVAISKGDMRNFMGALLHILEWVQEDNGERLPDYLEKCSKQDSESFHRNLLKLRDEMGIEQKEFTPIAKPNMDNLGNDLGELLSKLTGGKASSKLKECPEPDDKKDEGTADSE